MIINFYGGEHAQNQNEQIKLAEHLLALEKAALEKWFKGDSSGYLNLWSKTNFCYFDGFWATRVDEYSAIKQFIKSTVDGKLHADNYHIQAPRAARQRYVRTHLPTFCRYEHHQYALQRHRNFPTGRQ